MKVEQHIPGFVSGIEPHHVDVDSLDALLALSWVDAWTRDVVKGHPFTGWYRGELLRAGQRLLMAVYGENASWWVVAIVDAALVERLPEWHYPGRAPEL